MNNQSAAGGLSFSRFLAVLAKWRLGRPAIGLTALAALLWLLAVEASQQAPHARQVLAALR